MILILQLLVTVILAVACYFAIIRYKIRCLTLTLITVYSFISFGIYPILFQLFELPIELGVVRLVRFQQPGYIQYLISVFILACSLLFFTSRRTSCHFNIHSSETMIRRQKKIIPTVFASSVIAIMASITIFCLSTGYTLLDIANISRFEWLQGESNVTYLVLVSQYCSFFAAPLGYSYIFMPKTRINTFFLIIAIIAGMMYFIATKDRKFPIFLASGFISGLWLHNGFQIKLTPKAFLISLLLLMTLFVSNIFRDLLPELSSTSYGSYIDTRLKVVFGEFFYKNELSYPFLASVLTANAVATEKFFCTLCLIRRNLLVFVPSSLSFGLKPPDLSLLFGNYIEPASLDAIRESNMPPGLLGLSYISFGFALSCIMIFLAIGFLFCLDTKMISSRLPVEIKVSICSTFCASAMYLVRGDDSTAVYVPLFLSFILLGASVVYYIVRRPSAV